MTFLLAYLTTVLVEFFGLYLLIGKKIFWALFCSLIINTITWPLASYFYNHYLINFWLVEIGVIMAESILLAGLLKTNYLKALSISTKINLLTILISLIIRYT